MKVLVTGGAGYIGSVVVEELLARGHEVVVFDDLSKGHRDAVGDGATFVKGDLLDGPLLRRTLEGTDAVVHMAAASLVGESVRDPAHYWRQNVVGGLALLDAMRAARVERLVFSSTAAVYGEPVRQPIREDDPLVPTNPYGATKLTFERALATYDAAYGLRSISLRYFNAAGASQRCGERHDPETHLIPLVLRAALDGGTISIYGNDYPTPDGTCVRDYIHVVDLARAHVLALEALAAGAATTAYNLGCGGEGDSVLQVLDTARAVTRRDFKVLFGPRRPGDPPVLVASSERISRELGWRPERRNLVDIIDSAWRWMAARG